MDRVMNCQLLQDESDRPQMNYRPHLNNQPLNFTTNPDDCDVQAAKKAKTPRDPMSHRIIEKRRRDRMNNCLADLSRLIPANDMKQGQGRIEKTEIIEMAIKHIRQLKTRLQAHEASKTANPVEQSFPSANCHLSSCCSEKFYMGFKECQAELMRFLVENEGWNAKDQICNRLHKQLDEASQKYKGNFSAPEAFGSESKKEGASPQPSVYSASEYASGEHYNSPAPSSVYESDLIDLATYKSSNCHNFSLSQDKHLHMLLAKSNSSNTENESGVATMIPSTDYSGDMLSPEKLSSKSQGSDSERREVCGSIGSGHRYKFKQNITLRFSEEKRKASDSSSNSSSENNKVKVRRKICKTKSPSPESDSSIYPPSDYSSNGNGSSYTSDTQTPPKMHGDHKDVKEEFPLKEAHLPGFLLHPLGSFYFPITLSESQVSKLGYLPYADSPQQSHNFLHPISIPVNFGSHLVTLRNINVKSDYRNATKVCCVEQMDSSNA